ncbi:MAG: DUF3592 domain-containing protein [Akkermansiaceae bacterium]
MQTQGMGGLLYLAFIGLALAGMGALFVVILGRGYLTARETMSWDKVEVVIMESKVGERKIGPSVPVEYQHDLVYEYRWEGNFYRGDRTKRRENPHLKSKAKIEAEVERWKLGEKFEAWVNPEKPEEAVLEHDTRAPGYSIWFPGLFLVGGLGVFFRALFKMFGRTKE